jgi:DNA-binding SARP family transcriptional activator/lipopolysaccharide biosynthesis regulator YciM
MGGALDIRLLGSPSVTINGSEVEVDTRKAIAMLAFLAIEHAADRDTLAALFWADSSPDRARATLRRTLSSLRGGIGPDAIVADRNRVALVEGFFCDVDEFETVIGATATHDHDAADVCPRCTGPLTVAAELYRGDFLGAFSVRDAPEFEDWTRTMTESLKLKAGNVFRRLAMALASSGDYSAAIAAATRWVGLDELHEPAHRLLMLLHAWAGDRPGSIQAYRDSVAVLDRELGVAPLEETTELFEAILDDDLPPAPALRKPVRAHKWPLPEQASEMIDRISALEVLADAIGGARTSEQTCLITGDAWMGKTRLIESAVEIAGQAGFEVVTARAFRAEAKLPYGVVTQLLGSLLAGLERAGTQLPDWVGEELARLDPRIAPGVIAPGSGRLGQLRLREAFLALVESVAATRPLLVTIDDAQWIDATSANLVSVLQRRANGARLLRSPVRDPSSLHPALREIAAGADSSISLRPLQPSDLALQFPDIDVGTIIEETGGIPLLVKEAIDTGGVAPDSASVTGYMESRRRRMSDLGRQVLATAAVLDGMCDAQLLRDTSGRTEDEIVEAVEELVSAGLLREMEDNRLGFTLDVLETITYESTSLIRRRLLHKRAGEALAARPRTRLDARLATATAEHLRAAGGDDAAEWFCLAGDLSRAVFANDEAAVAYENAMALGHSDVGRIRLALGEIAMTRGDYDTAVHELRSAVSQSGGAMLALVEHRIGDLNRILGRFDLAEESFKRAEPDHPDRANLYADWALLKHRTGDAEAAVSLATAAVETARETSDHEHLARSLNILGVVTEETNDAMRHIDTALELAGTAAPARMAALNNKAHLLGETGDHESAIALVTEAIAIADKAGYRHHQAALLNHLADLNHRLGREEEAQRSLTDAVRIFADIDAGDWRPEVWLLTRW